jgi:hypothetical protein
MIGRNVSPVKKGRRMQLELGKSKVNMTRDQVIALRDGVGVRVTCVRGALWITEERSGTDVVLEAGQTHTIMHRGLTLVMALRDASLRVREPQAALWPRVRGWLERLGLTRLEPRGIG